MLARLKITMRIRLLLALGTLGLLALSGIGLWTLRSQMIEDRKAQLRNLMDLTLSVARAAMKNAGGSTSEAGRKAFFDVLQSARFGNQNEQNYFFAFDYDGIMKSHIDPKKVGHLLNAEYAKGVQLVPEFIRIAKSPEGAGFINYSFEKGPGGPLTPKLAFIQNAPEIGGLVGIGAYIDDVDADTYRQLFIEGALLAAVLATIGAAGVLIGRTLMAMTSQAERQLERAIAFQNDMLPSSEWVAQIQSCCPLDLSSYYKPRDGIGGDIWGIEGIGPQRMMLYIADFSGHGVSAALNTVRLHSFVHGKVQDTDDPARLLRKLNRTLHAVLPAGQFATMFCAKIDFNMQTLEYSSAGAPPQLYRKSSEDAFEVISQPSLPLGIVSDVVYESQMVAFCPGGGLVLYSDGLIETPHPPRSLCTTESVREHLNKTNQATTSLELCQSLLGEYSRPAIKANDDITIVIVKHTGGAVAPLNTYEI